MPRRRKVAEGSGGEPPKRKAGEHTSEAEMMTRRRIMRGLMLVSSSPDQCLAAMQSKFSNIDRATVIRLYKEAEQELIDRDTDKLEMKRRKQEARLLGEIAKASGKGASNAVASLEGKYADIAGTNAPVQVRHEISISERVSTAYQRTLALLTAQQAKGLLNGKSVPLGAPMTNGHASIDVAGEERK